MTTSRALESFDLDHTRVRAPYVRLAARYAGPRGDVALGDGILGIQNAFHIAGARNVIAGLWKVPDEPTAELMSDFYRLLWVEHQTPLAALRKAQLNMLHRERTTSASLRSPGPELSKTVRLNNTFGSRARNCRTREWAGFVLSGPGF